MKLSELIAKYGDDIVELQKMDDCTSQFDMTKQGSKGVIHTTRRFGPDGWDKLGLIVWMDRDRVATILASDKEKGG